MSIWDLTGAELAVYCAPVAPKYPSASPALAAVLENITALSGADQAALAKAFRAAEPPKQRRLATSRTMGAEAFFDAFQDARARAGVRYGHRWTVSGVGHYATLPRHLRSFTGPRGGKITLPRDIHVPPADCWEGGIVPAELALVGPVASNGMPMGDKHPYIIMLRAAMADQAALDAAWKAERRAERGRVEMIQYADAAD